MAIEVRVRRLQKFKMPDMEDARARIGWFSDQKYDKNTSIAQVAAWNEFGTKDIPSRPFMRSTAHTKQTEWRELLKKMAKDAIANGKSIETVMQQFGELVKGDIQAAIINTTTPPNAPATIKIKGFNKPLVHSGIMLGSVQSRTDKEK